MPKVVIVNEKDKKEIEVEPGANLRLAARQQGVELYKGLARSLNCRGFGLCGTCRILVKRGMENLSPRTLAERINLTVHPLTLLASIGHEDEMRLACQVAVNGDCAIETQVGINWTGENFWQKPYPNK
jgi:ferredoxin